jgi:RNA-directed DNA polymerase
MALDGLEAVAQQAARNQKINVIKYADDFVITGASKEVLEQRVKPAVTAFLRVRGLELSEEKTHITHIDDGFDFLGFNVRKYNGKLLIKPAKASVKHLLTNIRALIKTNKATTTEQLIRQLNNKLRGWANYYRHVVSKETFSYVDAQVFRALMSWINRRHPRKSAHWKKQHYFRCDGLRQWVFFAPVRDKSGGGGSYSLRSVQCCQRTHRPVCENQSQGDTVRSCLHRLLRPACTVAPDKQANMARNAVDT